MKKLLLLCYLVIGSAAIGHGQTNSLASHDLVEKARNLQKQLNLTDVQTNKVTVIFQESSRKFEKIKVTEHGNTDKIVVTMAPLRTETIRKIMILLTPAQTVKFDKLIEQINNWGGDRRSAGRSAVSSNQ